ncbi:uncharacterized protein conserved in bacteria [Serpentinimonas raichei]|jgi:Zn-finger nucleic acid-binding protein|uniref:Uncharacterized protein conserved in bacteria n=1 Tax=Serpentinimonas raichei TaxID=1458425 RepID=A0A060NIQ3_9BURK|nr:zf-TFIIB domain-containing protein [Serpentinimonas raichei]BAO82011.1 uncharacterized protein conserved in bacteria [Serpentinimonas raichei]
MKCPNCVNVELVMSDRQGVEIDYCPQCRGVWLDRGELDKLIERSLGQAPAGRSGAQVRQPDFEDSDFRQRSGGFAQGGGLGSKLGGLAGGLKGGLGGGLSGGFAAGSGQKKKKSWLSDIFD